MMRFLTYICVIVVACIPIKCLQFQIDRTSPRVPGAFCARLSCQENLATDPVTYSLVNMSIYRESNDRMLLASLTEMDGQLRHQGHTGVKVNGSIGKTSANMEVLMSVTSYCQDTAFVCQVMFADDKGQIGVREKVVPPSTKKVTDNMRSMSKKSRSSNRADMHRRRRSPEQIGIDPAVQRNESSTNDESDTKNETDKVIDVQATDVTKREQNSDKKKTEAFIETHQTDEKTIERLDSRLANVENMFEILNKRFGISINEILKSDANETGRFIKWPFSLADFVSQPKQITCERNMDSNYPKMTLVVLENGRVVMCDTETDGGGWIVMQRRVIGDVSFYRDWHDYKHGFGSYNGDFWLGNDVVSNLTSQGLFDLRIEIGYSNTDYVIVYNSFRVEDESSWYKLRLGQMTTGSHGDLAHHKDMEFYTHDRDTLDQCATKWMGGWWYHSNDCYNVNPNGVFNIHSGQGLQWITLTSSNSISRVEFKFRRHAN